MEHRRAGRTRGFCEIALSTFAGAPILRASIEDMSEAGLLVGFVPPEAQATITVGQRVHFRFVLSTVVGEAFDTLIFYPLAFLGGWDTDLLLKVMMTNYGLKVGWEILATPLTYRVVGFLKRKEQEDYFDRDTDFNPFSLKT